MCVGVPCAPRSTAFVYLRRLSAARPARPNVRGATPTVVRARAAAGRGPPTGRPPVQAEAHRTPVSAVGAWRVHRCMLRARRTAGQWSAVGAQPLPAAPSRAVFASVPQARLRDEPCPISHRSTCYTVHTARAPERRGVSAHHTPKGTSPSFEPLRAPHSLRRYPSAARMRAPALTPPRRPPCARAARRSGRGTACTAA